MKPHLHLCPHCHRRFDCRGYSCEGVEKKECPRCLEEFEQDGDDEDYDE